MYRTAVCVAAAATDCCAASISPLTEHASSSGARPLGSKHTSTTLPWMSWLTLTHCRRDRYSAARHARLL